MPGNSNYIVSQFADKSRTYIERWKIKTDKLTEVEYQLLFQYLIDCFTFDAANRNYPECKKLIVKHINYMTAAERRETLKDVLDRNRDLYNSYCEAVGNQTNDIAKEVQI